MSKEEVPEWEKQFWANRQQQKQQQPQVPGHTPQNNSWKEIDLNQALQQRVLGNINNSSGVQQQNNNMVFLREGYDHYTNVEGASGFGATIPMVKSLGKLQSNIQGRQFVIKGEVSAYCIDNLPSVDLSKINEYPERKLVLIRIAENMFSREILVPRGAIAGAGSNDGRTVLKG